MSSVVAARLQVCDFCLRLRKSESSGFRLSIGDTMRTRCCGVPLLAHLKSIVWCSDAHCSGNVFPNTRLLSNLDPGGHRQGEKLRELQAPATADIDVAGCGSDVATIRDKIRSDTIRRPASQSRPGLFAHFKSIRQRKATSRASRSI